MTILPATIDIDGVALSLSLVFRHRPAEAADCRELGLSRGTPGCGVEILLDAVRVLSVDGMRISRDAQTAVGDLLLAAGGERVAERLVELCRDASR